MFSRQTSRYLFSMAFVFTMVLLCEGTAVTQSLSSRSGRAPTAPTNLSVTGVTETTISLQWGPTRHNRPFSYRVRLINLNNSAYNTLATVSSAQTTYTARFLAYNNNYSITVYAVDDRGVRSPDSNTVTQRTLADETPPSVPTLTTTTLGPSQIRLDWTRPTDNIPLNCCSFAFLMNGAPLTQHINWWGEGSVVIRHLAPAGTYTFNVKATDYAGNTSTSNSSTSMTEPSSDTTPPSPPTNLRLLRDNGCAEVWLGWTQSTDDMDPQHTIEYEIYVNGILSPLAVSAGVSEDFVYGTGFPENIFVVRAVDRTGNTSAPSDPITVNLWPC